MLLGIAVDLDNVGGLYDQWDRYSNRKLYEQTVLLVAARWGLTAGSCWQEASIWTVLLKYFFSSLKTALMPSVFILAAERYSETPRMISAVPQPLSCEDALQDLLPGGYMHTILQLDTSI